ncbi:hypothetical protein BpHYR1_046559 [Brachionus plicatilis]|uniref:Uncharacterized protein n=1 Tax=Brachionus plicatilis TaxID=10195 RepID=A0A3M7R905_BRAPC|nr:hypothetical protein BpHYR1_046559 [Brachionus plicatilis]
MNKIQENKYRTIEKIGIESITRRVNERKRGSLIGFMESKSNTKYSKQVNDLMNEIEEIDKKKKLQIIENLNQINGLIQDEIIEFSKEKLLLKND